MRTLLLVTIFLALGLPASAADDHRDFEDETLCSMVASLDEFQKLVDAAFGSHDVREWFMIGIGQDS